MSEDETQKMSEFESQIGNSNKFDHHQGLAPESFEHGHSNKSQIYVSDEELNSRMHKITEDIAHTLQEMLDKGEITPEKFNKEMEENELRGSGKKLTVNFNDLKTHQYKLAEDRTRTVNKQLENGEITPEQFRQEIESNKFQAENGKWYRPGGTAGKWESLSEGDKWEPTQAPFAGNKQAEKPKAEKKPSSQETKWIFGAEKPAATPPAESNPSEEEDGKGTGWENAGGGNGGNENTPPEDVFGQDAANWYRELAENWQTKPQTKEYWIGNNDKKIADKRSILQMADMTDIEINDLIQNHTIQGGQRPTRMPRPEDTPEANATKQRRPEHVQAQPNPDQNAQLDRGQRRNERREQAQHPINLDENGENASVEDPDYRIIQAGGNLEGIRQVEREAVINEFLEKVELEYGETSINALPGNMGKAMRSLEGIIKKYDEDPTQDRILSVKTMKLARARIRVHDMNAALLFLNFKPEDIRGDIRTKLQNISAGGRVIDGEDLAVLLKGNIGEIERYKSVEFGETLPVGQAMNEIQSAAVEGIMVDGTRLYWGDKRLSPDQTRSLRAKLQERLPENCNRRASLRLAERLAKITFEASVWDVNASDPIAQVFYMKASREDVVKKIENTEGFESAVTSDDYGPGITLGLIPGFGTSLIRRASYKIASPDDPTGKKKIEVRLANNTEWKRALRLIDNAGNNPNGVEEGINQALVVNRIAKNSPNNLLIDYTNLLYEKLPGNVFNEYYQRYLPALKTAEAYLLKSEWKPADFSRDKINDMNTAFKFADPGDVFYLRGTFIYGVLEENLGATAIEQGTKGTFKDANALESFLRILSTPSPGQKVQFMSKEELNAIRRKVKPMVRAELQSIFDDAFGKVIKTSQ